MTTPVSMEAPHLLSRLRIGLGTFVAIEAEANTRAAAERGIAAAAAAIATVERLMHPDRRGSNLAALTAAPAGRALRVHPWTWEVLTLCVRLHRASSGIFDPCLGDAPGRLEDLELPCEGTAVPRAALRIDLGGVAKGYAVDRALESLRAAGCSGGLINAGGDLAAFGPRRRAILCRGDRDAVVVIKDAALATSDASASTRPPGHRGYYHGGDRGARVTGRVTVRAARAAVADGLTKCLLPGDATLRASVLAAFDAELIA